MKQRREIDLSVRTRALAVRIIELYEKLPSTVVAQVIGKQILRSGTSVGANYREATRARSPTEFVAKIGICIQELEESQYWLSLLPEAKIIPMKRLELLDNELKELIAILTASAKNTQKTK